VAKCNLCMAETELHNAGVPICIECTHAAPAIPRTAVQDHEIDRILREQLQAATLIADQASEAFSELMTEIPSGLPYPDSTHRIHCASRDLSAARKEVMAAHQRLHEFLSSGLIPHDLMLESKEK